MRRLATFLFIPAAFVALSACAYENGPSYGAAATPYYYDGYYDNYYGSTYGGYWGADGFFYYQSAPRRPYIRDTAHHFRHDQTDGFHPFHMRDPGDHEHHEHPPGGHR